MAVVVVGGQSRNAAEARPPAHARRGTAPPRPRTRRGGLAPPARPRASDFAAGAHWEARRRARRPQTRAAAVCARVAAPRSGAAGGGLPRRRSSRLTHRGHRQHAHARRAARTLRTPRRSSHRHGRRRHRCYHRPLVCRHRAPVAPEPHAATLPCAQCLRTCPGIQTVAARHVRPPTALRRARRRGACAMQTGSGQAAVDARKCPRKVPALAAATAALAPRPPRWRGGVPAMQRAWTTRLA